MTSEEFEALLETYRGEAETGLQFYYAYRATHAVLGQERAALDGVNRTALYWRTVDGALVSAAFITLGRLFDQNSAFNLDLLIKSAQDNPDLFTKDALAQRKRKRSGNADTWLLEFLKDVHVPTPDDFRAARKQVAKYRRVYETAYRIIRDKVYAHRELTTSGEMQAAYGATNIRELDELFAFLAHVHEVFWQLLFNGRMPDWKFEVLSPDDILKRGLTKKEAKALPERLTVEVRELFESLSAGSAPGRRAHG